MRGGVEIALSTTAPRGRATRGSFRAERFRRRDPRLGRGLVTSRSSSPVLVNQSFAMQRVTGQQRYAAEIARRLLASEQVHARRAPAVSGPARRGGSGRGSSSCCRGCAGGSLLLSMTSRAPWWRRRQVLVVHDLFVLTNPGWFSRLYYLTHAPAAPGPDPQRGRGRRRQPADGRRAGIDLLRPDRGRPERPERDLRRPATARERRAEPARRAAPVATSWRSAAWTRARTCRGWPRRTRG